VIGAEHKQQTVAPETDHKRTVVVVGSTGSIGTQALEVIADNPDKFELVGLAAGGSRPELLCQQARHFAISAEFLAVADKAAAQKISQEFGENIASGPDAAATLCAAAHADVVLNAMDGSRGLPVTLAALSAGSTLALANKESLVAGGRWVLEQAAEGQIVPVDSEHSAMAQALRSGRRQELSRLVLTASGGPFRGWDRERMWDVTPQQAAAHPTWSMGQMNTLNSATLINKGLELIEATLLFDIEPERIDVTVHPQSVIHSMATFKDGCTIAQASPPSMKLPISLALNWPQRVPGAQPALDFSQAHTWHFEPLDDVSFPAVSLAREAAAQGTGVIYNAANEEAAAAFLSGRIHFPEIVDVVGEILGESSQFAGVVSTLDEILAVEGEARRRANARIDRLAD